MGQPTDERTNAMLSAKAGRRKFVGAGLVALVALAGGGVGLKWLLDSGDGGESANGGLVDMGQLTATPTSPAQATPTSTPEAAAGHAVQGTHVAENGCPGVTLDYIAQTGQTNKLTVPFSGCVDAQWVAVPLDAADPNQKRLVPGMIAYTIQPGTDIMMPIDGTIKLEKANEQGALGIGGYVCSIDRGGDISASMFLFDPVLDLNIDGRSISRGTSIGKSGTALPPTYDLGAANLVLGFFTRSSKATPAPQIVDLAKPDYWVDGKVATAFLAE